MAGKDEVREVIAPGAFDEHLPATLPVHGMDGEIIEGATADFAKDTDGLSVSITMPSGEKIAGHIRVD